MLPGTRDRPESHRDGNRDASPRGAVTDVVRAQPGEAAHTATTPGTVPAVTATEIAIRATTAVDPPAETVGREGAGRVTDTPGTVGPESTITAAITDEQRAIISRNIIQAESRRRARDEREASVGMPRVTTGPRTRTRSPNPAATPRTTEPGTSGSRPPGAPAYRTQSVGDLAVRAACAVIALGTGPDAPDRTTRDSTAPERPPRRRALTPTTQAPHEARATRPRPDPVRTAFQPAADRPGRDPESDTARPPDERDALQAVWARHRNRSTGLCPIVPHDRVLSDMLTNGTWTHHSINRAVDALAADGILERIQASSDPGDSRGHIRLLRVDEPLRDLSGTSQLQAAVPPAPGRPCYLVSLFDATGTARYATGDVFKMLGQAINFQGSALVEIDQTMAQRVQQYWDSTEAQNTDGGPPHTCLAHDVWDLFKLRQDGTSIWSEFLATIPEDSLVLILGGSPCNNLSRAGTHRGVDGLAGMQSRHFFAIPFAAHIAVHLRPGLHVQTMVENVYPMDAVSHRAMLEALGNLPE